MTICSVSFTFSKPAQRIERAGSGEAVPPGLLLLLVPGYTSCSFLTAGAVVLVWGKVDPPDE